jgi:hypothetical protein
MATINASQDYDIIQTLTFAEASGTCKIRLYRGSNSAYTGTVKVRAGTSGAWSNLSVSGTATTFNVTNTTMQIAHDWNKNGNNYMTCSFYGQSTNLTGIAISQKAILSGAIGNNFMYYYAYGCTGLTSLSVPDTSNITSVVNSFMQYYANGCSNLTSLDVPDTSNVTSVGNYFMQGYALYCSTLTSLDVPDTSNVTSVGDYFMASYANGCSNLTSLDVPDTSGITSVGNSFMQYYASTCSTLTSLDVPDTSGITSVWDYFMANYAQGCSTLTSLSVPDTSGITTVGNYFMANYAQGCRTLTSLNVPDTSGITTVGNYFMKGYAQYCNTLTTLVLPSVGWFATHDVVWSVPASRLNYLKGKVINSADLAGWQALTTSTSPNTLYLNYIRNTADVYVYSSNADATKFFMFI